MTYDGIANRIAKEIANVHNAMYEALKKKDIESYMKLASLEDNLKNSLVSFGYETTLVYEEGSPMMYWKGAVALKATGASIGRIKGEN